MKRKIYKNVGNHKPLYKTYPKLPKQLLKRKFTNIFGVYFLLHSGDVGINQSTG
ncbi:MAG: hypothetical protein ACYT04_46515 [Nostoc sp.]